MILLTFISVFAFNDSKTNFITLFIKHFICFSLEGVDGILMWGFWDQAHWRPEAAITTGDDCHTNAAGDAYLNVYYNVLQTHDVFEPTTNDDGDLEFTFRAFRGEYDVTLVDAVSGRAVGERKAMLNVNGDVVYRCEDCL